MNKIILIGRLTRDIELRYTNSGNEVANFTLAVDRPFTNQQGEKETDFVNIVVWKKQAENCANYLLKGSKVAVEGRLQIRKYEDKEGIKRTAAEVVADRVEFLDTKKKQGDEPDGVVEAAEQVFAAQDDDIPF